MQSVPDSGGRRQRRPRSVSGVQLHEVAGSRIQCGKEWNARNKEFKARFPLMKFESSDRLLVLATPDGRWAPGTPIVLPTDRTPEDTIQEACELYRAAASERSYLTKTDLDNVVNSWPALATTSAGRGGRQSTTVSRTNVQVVDGFVRTAAFLPAGQGVAFAETYRHASVIKSGMRRLERTMSTVCDCITDTGDGGPSACSLDTPHPLGNGYVWKQILTEATKTERAAPQGRDEAESVFCVCGWEGDSERGRLAHAASSTDGGVHAKTPDRLERLGGAFTVVDVADCSNVTMRFAPVKFLF